MLLYSTEVVLQGNSNCSRKKLGGWQDCSLKFGWRTFTKAHAEHNILIKLNKLLFVSETASDQEGQLPLVFDVSIKLFVQM